MNQEFVYERVRSERKKKGGKRKCEKGKEKRKRKGEKRNSKK